MKKKEFLERCWVHYTKRLPEDDAERTKRVVVWNYKLKKPWVLYSFVVRNDYIRKRKDPSWPGKSPNDALFHDHWMDLPGPVTEITN